MCLATNGLLVTPKICEKIKKSGIQMISLSLDGSTDSVHDDFRQQPGAFQATIRAAEYFNEHHMDFLINSSFTKRNQHDIAKCFKLAKSLGAKAWYLFMVIPTGHGEALLNELISEKYYQEILDWHCELEEKHSDILLRPTCAPHYYRVRFEKEKKKKSFKKHPSLSLSPSGRKGCLAGQHIALLDAEGNIQPCSYFPLSAGNIRHENFQTIWESYNLMRSLRDFSQYKDRCGECEFIKICGDCRARAHVMNNNFLAQDPFCSYTPSRR